MHKNSLRLKYKELRKLVTDKEEKLNKLYLNVLSNQRYRDSKNIAIFVGFKDEIKTEKLIDLMLKDGKVVCLPFIDGKKMTFHVLNDLSELIENKMGIKEPPYTNQMVKRDEIDLMYVPGLCFDCRGYRVGYGGGYYDRYLEDSQTFTIGLAYHEQYLQNEIIEVDEHDIRLNAFMSDEIYQVFE